MKDPLKHVMDDESNFPIDWDGQVEQADACLLEWLEDGFGGLPVSVHSDGQAVSGHIRQVSKLGDD